MKSQQESVQVGRKCFRIEHFVFRFATFEQKEAFVGNKWASTCKLKNPLNHIVPGVETVSGCQFLRLLQGKRIELHAVTNVEW